MRSSACRHETGDGHGCTRRVGAIRLGAWGTGRDALEGGEVPCPPFRAPSLCPATVSLTPSASLNGIRNRQ